MALQLSVLRVFKREFLSSTSGTKFQHKKLVETLRGTKTLPILGIAAQSKSKTTTDSSQGVTHKLHVSSQKSYPAAKPLPLPDNIEDIDDSELSCFSPMRDRDISGSVILSKTDTRLYDHRSPLADPHLASYDCHGALSLNSAMQTNVPEPFSSKGKSTYLNMPGGQWSRGQKYISEDMQKNHYSKMARDHKGSTRSDLNLQRINTQVFRRYFSHSIHHSSIATNRTYCTSNNGSELSRKDKLKRAVKEYGTTVVVFHVGISLLSLGGCYLAVTSGVSTGGMLNSLGPGSEVAVEAGQFVVAYAIHKMFAPVRITITLASTPFIVRYLRQRGFLKAPKPPV